MECAICLDTYDSSNAVKLNCSHNFHNECIEKWKNVKNECPVCRESIDNEEHVVVIEPLQEPRRIHTNHKKTSSIFIKILGYVYLGILFTTKNSLYFYMATLNFIACQSLIGMFFSFLFITNNILFSMNGIHFMYILFPLNLFLLLFYLKDLKWVDS